MTYKPGGSGSVTSVSVTTANGVSGSVATATTTPAITLALGAITPSSVAASGTVTGSNLSGTHSGTSSGTNTGDQTSVTGNAGTVTTVDAGGDTTTWPMLATSQTGNLSPATDAGLTYDASTNALTAATFVGALSGNATTSTNTTGNAATVTTNANLTGPVTSVGNATTITNAAVTLAKIANAAAASKLLGSGSAGSGSAYSEITLGSGLSMSGTTLSASGASGDVVGPASSTDNAIARFDSTTGKLLQDSAATIADTSGAITIVGSAGAAPTTVTLSHDTNRGAWAVGTFQSDTATLPAVLSAQVPSGDTLTASVIGASTPTAFSTKRTIKANTLIANKVLRVDIGFKITSASLSKPTYTFDLKLGSTIIATFANNSVASSITDRACWFHFLIGGTAAAGASVNVETTMGGLFLTTGGAVSVASTVAQPVAVATNADKDLTLVMTYSTNTAGYSTTLTHFIVTEIN